VTPAAPSRVRGLWEVARLSFRQTLAQRAAWIGRSVFLVLILIVFSRLWLAVERSGALAGTSAADLLWYLAITEWIVIGLPLTHVAIEADVRSGDIAALLPRPLPWLAVKVAEGLGSLAVRLLALGVTGFAAAWVLAGGLPREPRGLLLAVPLGVLAGALGTLFHALVGLSSFWMSDCSPAHWVFQKLCFLLGGLILPLAIYPEWLRTLAEVTPFSALLHGPGRMALGWDPALALRTAAMLVGWTALTALATALVWRRALRRLDVGGG
jgi:ABC-2 type transport system permease protein